MSLDLKSIEIRRTFDGVMAGKVYFADDNVSLAFTLTDEDMAAITGLVANRLVDNAQRFAAQMSASLVASKTA